VTGTVSGWSDKDLCWYGRPPLSISPSYTVAYTADVTALVTGNGTYAVTGIVDPNPDSSTLYLGEGFTLLVIYSNPALPLKQVNVYSGMATTETGVTAGRAEGTLQFTPFPYLQGPVHFFINALDGQRVDYGWPDDFFVNSIRVSGQISGTGIPGNAWEGLLGPDPGAPFNNLYDQADDDASAFIAAEDRVLQIATYDIIGGYPDCIGHSFAAVAFAAIDPCQGVSNPPHEDCNDNGIWDACDIADCGDPNDPSNLWCQDCNANGVPDACDIAAEISLDENENGIPDECEEQQRGQGMQQESFGDPEAYAEAWAAYWDWARQQTWGPNSECTGAEQLQRLVAKLQELGLPMRP
jgi:hypothetical protein